METELDKFFANVQKDEVTIEELSHPKQDTVEEKTTPEPQPETKTEEGKPSQVGDTNTPDENIPFHKHPRWIAREKENAELRSQLAELTKFKEEVGPVVEKMQKPASDAPNLPKWWKTVYGDTEDSVLAFFEYQEEHKNERERIKQEILEDQKRIQEQEKNEVNKWSDFIETNITSLKEKGLVFDRNELLKVVDDYSKDANGNYLGNLISFEKAYEILQLQKGAEKNPAKDIERKKIAGKTASNNSGVDTGKNPVNKIGSLVKKGWGDWN